MGKNNYFEHDIKVKYTDALLTQQQAWNWLIELRILYEDNGKGLSDKYKKNPDLILEPFETNKRDTNNNLIGTGMGMWIINKTVKEYHGVVDLSQNKGRESGFITIINLKGVFK